MPLLRIYCASLIVAVPLLNSCATMDNVTRPEHRHSLQFARDYQTVYRIVVQRMEECMNNPGAVRGNLFPDSKSARVFVTGSAGATVGSVHDIKATSDGAILDYYPDICLICTKEMTERRIERLKRWINDDSKEC